jgi:hypothetical protein
MNSFYEELFGVNPFASQIKCLMGLDAPPDALVKELPCPNEFYDFVMSENRERIEEFVAIAKKAHFYPTGKFRDICINEEGTKVELLTKNGLEDYWWVNEILRSHPCFIRDIKMPALEDNGKQHHFEDYMAMEFKVPKTLEEFIYSYEIHPISNMDEFETVEGATKAEWLERALEESNKFAKELSEISDTSPIHKNFVNLIKKIKAKDLNDPLVKRAIGVTEKIMSKVKEVVGESENIEVHFLNGEELKEILDSKEFSKILDKFKNENN